MRELRKITEGAQRLTDMIYAPMYTKILFAAIELDIFDRLEQEKGHAELAEELGLNRSNTQSLLDALSAMDLLEKRQGLYKNTALSSQYLLRNCDWFIGDYVRVSNLGTGFEDIDIVKAVKEGPDGTNDNMQGLEAYAQFGDYTEMLKTGQRGGGSREIAALAASLPEFGGFKRMLDLGGGPGLTGIAIVKEHPVMEGIIFDTPEVGKTAAQSIKEYGMEKRMRVMTGDYITDSIGGEYDFVLAMSTLNFAKHTLDSVIKKIYEALNPGGVFMCISEGLTEDMTKPCEMVAAWLPSRLRGYDFALRQGEISDAAVRSGFKSVYKRTLNLFAGKMDIDIARK